MNQKESAPTTADEGTKTTDTNITTVDNKPSVSGKGLGLGSLSAERLAELRASGISDEVIANCGAYTAYATEDLPEPMRWIGRFKGAFPASVYELQETGKGTTWQVKPQPGSVVLADGSAPKCICPSKDSGYPVPSLIERRAVHAGTRHVCLVESTKQALAVVSNTDDDTAYTQAPAAYGQGTARDVFLEGVLNLPQELLEMIRIFVHDEIVLSVPRDRAEEIKQTVMAVFNAVTLSGKDGVEVPVLSDSAGPAASWAGCK